MPSSKWRDAALDKARLGNPNSLARNGIIASQTRPAPGRIAAPGDGRGALRDRDKQADRLIVIRLRYCLNTHLEDQEISTPAAIGAAVGLPGAEAVRLLSRHQWREGDVAALQAVAGRLGLEVPLDGLGRLAGLERALRDALDYIARVTPPRPAAPMPTTGATSTPGAGRSA